MTHTRRSFLATGLCLFVCGPTAVVAGEPGAKPLPAWPQVSQAIDRYYAKDKSRQPRDIITQSQTSPVFAELQKLGWNVADRDALLARVPSDNDFIVKQLRSKQGKEFMRDFTKYPDGFDKLDQLAKMPHGKANVEALVKGPDGYKLLEYMTTTKGGANLQKQLSHAPKGKGFTKETGRIYTVEALKQELKKSYARDAQPAAKRR
jgi:hypothetical protein